MSRAFLYGNHLSERRLKLLKAQGWTWQAFGRRCWYYPASVPLFREIDGVGICTARRGYYVGCPRRVVWEPITPDSVLARPIAVPSKMEHMLAGPFRSLDDAMTCYHIVAGVK